MFIKSKNTCFQLHENGTRGNFFIERGFGRNFEIVSGFSVKKMRADLYHFVQKREFTMICNSFFFCVSFVLFDDWMTAFFVCLDLKNEQRNRSFASKWGILDVIVKTQAFYAFYLYRLLDTSHCIPWKWRKTNHFDTFSPTIRRCFLIDTSLYICFIKHCHDDTFALPLDLGIRECTRLATWEPHSLERDFMMSS